MNKIGIYSGSFDPIHVGHIEFALEAIEEMALDKVFFLPDVMARGKSTLSAIEAREAMIRLGIESYPKLKLLLLDDEVFTVSYTLPKLQSRFEGSELVFLMGSDIVHGFTYRWDGLKELLQNVSLAVGLRADDETEYTSEIIETIAREYGVHANYKIIKAPRMNLTSTKVRSGTHTIEDVHPKVADYIKSKRLYH